MWHQYTCYFQAKTVRRIRIFFSPKPSISQGNHPSKFQLAGVRRLGGVREHPNRQTNSLTDWCLKRRIYDLLKSNSSIFDFEIFYFSLQTRTFLLHFSQLNFQFYLLLGCAHREKASINIVPVSLFVSIRSVFFTVYLLCWKWLLPSHFNTATSEALFSLPQV